MNDRRRERGNEISKVSGEKRHELVLFSPSLDIKKKEKQPNVTSYLTLKTTVGLEDVDEMCGMTISHSRE